MEPKNVSRKMLTRLPVYLAYLRSLPDHIDQISATALAKGLGMGEVQVRKDLARISGTGRCKTGRSRRQLIQELESHLEHTAQSGTIVVSDGQLGQALLDDSGFAESGLNVMAGFDLRASSNHSGTGKPIYSINRLEAFCKHYDVCVGIIAVPAQSAQLVCDCLIACGIRDIRNYAPIHLKVPDHVIVHSNYLPLTTPQPESNPLTA